MQHIFEKFFKKSTNPSTGVLRVSQGPKFGNPGAAILFFLFMALVIIAIVGFVYQEVTIALIIAILAILLLSYILDIQGIEVNFKKNKIRRYSSFLGFRRGKWFDLSNFEKIGITHDLLLEKRKFYPSARKGRYSHHNYYTLVLINDRNKVVIPIYESENPNHVKKAGKWLSHHSSLDFYSEIFKKGYEYC